MRITEILKQCVRAKTMSISEALAILFAVTHSVDCVRFDNSPTTFEILKGLVELPITK